MEPEELSLYWHNHALPSAEKAIQCIPPVPKASRFEGLSNLFPFIRQPTPLQSYSVNEPLKDTPQIFIFEDATGAGKTEAAVVLTHRLLNSGLAKGVFRELKDMKVFNSVRPLLGSIKWENGQDLCPDTLYLESKSLS
ncbi:MAG: DUF2442 domain-containing protein [Deltaproteobacteria bacterium]|nr:DUF2442 domain-containing protein [Deltaproteobacteria bacterium]